MLTTPRSLSACGLVAVLLLWPVAQRFRIDTVRCDSWPEPALRFLLCGLFLLAVLVLFFAWQRLLRLAERGQLGLRLTLGIAGLWHSAMLLCPPFLSDDPLFYLAIGRVLHAPQPSLHTPIAQVLGAQDDVVRLLPPHWQAGTSAYQAGFHALAWVIEALPGQALADRLSMYQALSLLLLLAAALISSQVAVRLGKPSAYGAALVGLSPLALLEGTLSAHNDVWLLLLLALGALLWLGKRRWLLWPTLLLGLLVKLSAVVPLGTAGLSVLGPVIRRHRRWMFAGLLFVAAALGFGLRLHPINWRTQGHLVSVLFGSPDLPWDHCTRSLECLPRSILRYGLDRPDLSYLFGIASRLLGGLWLVRVALREAGPLAAMAWGLLSYFLFWHGWAQTWYFLPVLPLRLFLSKPRGRALEVLCGSGCAYYALALYRNCTTEPWQVALCELVEGLITILPPSLCLLARND